MSIDMMNSKVQELRELRRMAEELQAEIDSLQDTIKAEMTAQNTDTLTGVDWRITWKPVNSTRIDTKSFKAALPELAERFTKTTTTRRFCVA